MKKTKKEAAIDVWNEAHPVGAAVRVYRDDGTTFDTYTRSEAGMLGGHTPVVWVVGLAGCYLLDRVKPRDEEIQR